jgi:hypothetical protein
VSHVEILTDEMVQLRDCGGEQQSIEFGTELAYMQMKESNVSILRTMT